MVPSGALMISPSRVASKIARYACSASRADCAAAGRLFRPLAGADVLDDGDKILGPPGGVAHQRGGEVDPDGGAVAAEVSLFNGVAVDLAGQEPADLGRAGRGVVGVGDFLEGHAHQLVAAVADGSRTAAGSPAATARRGRRGAIPTAACSNVARNRSSDSRSASSARLQSPRPAGDGGGTGGVAPKESGGGAAFDSAMRVLPTKGALAARSGTFDTSVSPQSAGAGAGRLLGAILAGAQGGGNVRSRTHPGGPRDWFPGRLRGRCRGRFRGRFPLPCTQGRGLG